MIIYTKKEKPLYWTSHAKSKMNFYRLSEQRVRRVLRSPKRIEIGIAPDTVAMMQPASVKSGKLKVENGGKKWEKGETWTQEIWVMTEETKKERKIISVWRYPGMTKPRSEIELNLLQREYSDYISNDINKK